MNSKGTVAIIGKKQKKGEFEGRQYQFTELSLLSKSPESQNGYIIETVRAGYNDYENIVDLPALYDCSVNVNYGKTTLADLKKISDIEIKIANEKGVKNG